MKPGYELDILVAEKVMGWTLGRGYWVLNIVVEPFLSKTLDPVVRWSPSTDIAAAWPLAEKLKMSVHAPGAPYAGGEYWNGSDFWVAEVDVDPEKDPERLDGATAPHAICLAALRAVGFEIPEEG